MEPTQNGSNPCVTITKGSELEVDRLELIYSKADRYPSSSRFVEKRYEPLAEIGNLAAVFAHEVANPLGGIAASLQFVLNDLTRTALHNSARTDLQIPTLQETLKGALREVDRLVELLNEFRLAVPTQTLNLKPTYLEQIIQEILVLEGRGYESAGIAVKLDFEAGLPAIEIDAAKIKQAILNLCKNAVEAMGDGGCLAIRAYRAEDMMVVEISDEGLGFPADMDAFELFKTTKPGGTGLGLAVVQQVVSAHRGTVDYTSDVEQGTTFTIRLPTSTQRSALAL